MGSFLDIQDDPNEVSGTGAILRSIGTSFKGQAQGILAEINAVNAERPWGGDQYGQAFEQTYNVVPEEATCRCATPSTTGSAVPATA
ncbi:hypothetical protein ACFQ1L_41865 [Phytohabitans flavus]|uniref:hypothetical protein n=1 Tax=Phytohabitans flavus TaxID=1076124 RepID=UPI003637F705